MAVKSTVAKKVAKAIPEAEEVKSEPKAKASARAATHSEGRVVETAQEARGGEAGPSVLALLSISTIAAGFLMAILWFAFFRT